MGPSLKLALQAAMYLTKAFLNRIRAQVIRELIVKFEELHDEYYSQGDLAAANVVVDLVAWLQDDHEALQR